MAQSWEDSGRSPGLLLEGQPLKEALATNRQALGSLVKDFLTASQDAQQRKEQEEQEKKIRDIQAFNARLSKRNRVITINVVATAAATEASRRPPAADRSDHARNEQVGDNRGEQASRA